MEDKSLLESFITSATKPTLSFPLLPLDKFCCKKKYEIELFIPRTDVHSPTIEKLVQIGKESDVSNIIFISFDDVMSMIKKLENNSPLNLPKKIVDSAYLLKEEIYGHISKQPFLRELPTNFLAFMTKLAIIESMYLKYEAAVKEMQRRKKLQHQFASLIKNCEQNVERTEKTKQTKKGKKNKGKNVIPVQIKPLYEPIILDYTEIEIETNDLILDFNIDNQILFIILSGFTEPHLLKELNKHNVDISAVVEFYSVHKEKPTGLALLFRDLFGNTENQYLENTILMKFALETDAVDAGTFRKLLDVVKKVNYIKRQHFGYIENLKLYDLGSAPPKVDIKCLQKYSTILGDYPTELVNIPVIIDALIEEICWKELGVIDATPATEVLNSFTKTPNPFQIHEEDNLGTALHFYKEAARKCYDITLKYLKMMHLFTKKVIYKAKFQDKCVSTENSCYCSNDIDLADSVHLAFFSQMRGESFLSKEIQETKLTSNLLTYNEKKAYDAVKLSSDLVADDENIIGIYQMKEDLSKSVLCQMIYRTMQSFSQCDRQFCDETEALLLRFHDNLDKSGVNVQLWGQSLQTPVCLRDFCLYISNQDNQWVQEQMKKPRNEQKDLCPGLNMLKILEEYKEYADLFDISPNSQKETFDNILSELIEYPKSFNLHKYCAGNSTTILAYNLGSRIVRVEGHTTTFHSDDGVKVSVDSSRLSGQKPQCSIDINIDDIHFLFHSGLQQFHFILQDQTLIDFSRENNNHTEKKEDKDIQEKIVNNIVDVPLKCSDQWIQLLRLCNLPTQPLKVDDKNLNNLLHLFKKAITLQKPLYKITTKSINKLGRLESPVRVPLVNVLKRILFKPKPKKRIVKSYSILNFYKLSANEDFQFCTKLTLPNGLHIINDSNSNIQQTYKFSTHKEKYRIFYPSGTVIIKNKDGSTTILRPNGDIIFLTTWNDSSHNIKNIFKSSDASRTKQSRTHELAENVDTTPYLYEFGEIPYNHKSILLFDGKRIEIFNGKSSEEQKYYLVNERDYHNGEIFSKREDGMRCLVKKNGTKIYQFPDGTKITATADFEKEFIVISGESESWVSVIINYKFEHPDYIPVVFDAFKKLTELFLCDKTISFSKNTGLITAKNTTAEITNNSVVLLKTCPVCDADCVAKINLKNTKPNSNFIQVYDSCGKYFTCSIAGKCRLDKNTNKNSCNHKERNEKAKYFILNKRGSPGTVIWNNFAVDTKIKMDNSKNVKISNYRNSFTGKQTIEIFTNVYQNYIGRFTASDFYSRNIELAKNSSNKKPDKLYYVTYRILTEFQNLNKDDIKELQNYLIEKADHMSPLLRKGLYSLIKYASNEKKTDSRSCSNKQNLAAEKVLNKNDTKQAQILMTVQEKIEMWQSERNKYLNLIKKKAFQPYFQSEHYKNK